MEEQKKLAAPRERVRLGKLLGNHSRHFLAFLICSAILVAAFAVSSVWLHRGGLEPDGSGDPGGNGPADTGPATGTPDSG